MAENLLPEQETCAVCNRAFVNGEPDPHCLAFYHEYDRPAVSAEIPAREDRFWIHDTLEEDQPDVPMPFGDATVGIVDEEGGVFLYVHEANAPAILAVLRGGGLYPPG